MIDVLIIIINWNTADMTSTCIQSIIDANHKYSYDICVIDNGSSDKSVEKINNRFPSIKIITNKQNRGFAAANNQAMDLSDSRYLLLLNSDTLVKHNSIDLLIDLADSNPKAGITAPKLIGSNEQVQNNIGRYPSFSRSIQKAFLSHFLFFKSILPQSKYNEIFVEAQNFSQKTRVEYVSGACMLVNRKAYNEVGKLDESFFFYGEDIDWCFRFSNLGWDIIYDPNISITHFGNMSGKLKWGDSRKAAQLFAERLLYKKLYGNFAEYIFGIKVILLYSMLYIYERIIKRNSINKYKTIEIYRRCLSSVFIKDQKVLFNRTD